MIARLLARGLVLVGLTSGTAFAAPSAFLKLEGPRDPTDAMDRPHGVVPPIVEQGALQLGMSPMFVHHARRGLELLYRRDYDDFRAHFQEMDEVFPGTAVGPISEILAWQAIMLEDFSFEHTAEYEDASSKARAALGAAIEQPGAEGWEHFMMAGVAGLESIHAARGGRYVGALRLAFEAIDHAEKTRKAAPDFVDLQLADGLYIFWRSALAGKIPMLGGYADRKDDGIAMMRRVAANGVFLAAPARLSLAFAWLEINRFDNAVDELAVNHKHYPNNLINEQMYGVSLMYAGRLSEAMAAFDRVQQIDDSTRRVHYYRGLVHYRAKRNAEAEKAFVHYLSLDGLEDHQRAWASYRIGRTLERQRRWAEAMDRYRDAVKTDGHDGAKKRIDHLRGLRRQGKIDL